MSTATRNGGNEGHPAAYLQAAVLPSPAGVATRAPAGARPLTIGQLQRLEQLGDREAMAMLDAWHDSRPM